MTRQANLGSDIYIEKRTGIPSRTINEWRREGIIPDYKDVENYSESDYDEVVRAIIAHLKQTESVGEYKEAKLRLTIAQAERVELDNALTKGEIVTLSDFIPEYEKLVNSFKAKMLNIPKAIAPQIEGLTYKEIESLLEDAVWNALNELSSLSRSK
jgi:phage terminase Nu1 subunit (DNA packaging protein)